ncbi:MAG: S41 family peptidase [Cyclobacteriaceae bacterium]|nr:S41 family peptidase [Cyclobacteriaceae bacterium]
MGNTRFNISAPILVAIGLAAGVLLGATMINQGTSDHEVVNSVVKFREVISNIEKSYVDDVESEVLVNDAISKMLEKLDPHSIYIPKSDVELTNADLKGEFEGIGIEFNIIRDTIIVVSPISGGPSEGAGIKSGDKIIEVDGENVAGIGINLRGVIDRLRGPKGSEVIVGILRRKSIKLDEFKIIRDKIPQFSVDVGYMINDQIGYIKISRFSATTYDEFRKELENLKSQGLEKLILDLQGNPGGYMDRAVNVADEFIAGDKLIVSQDGRVKRYNSEYRAFKKGLFEDGPLIVLINEGSASGSEIVAGALQDHDRALIVGRRSFGKGLVQMPIPLSDGSELRLTISRYYTPSGRSIQKPYNGDMDIYHADRIQRYEHGEFFNEDSIFVNDSLIYKTSKGRTVYGGGGIMPDYFVPMDTAYDSQYFTDLFYNNVIREYTLEYFNENRESLEKMGLDEFNNEFVVTENMLHELVKLGKKVEVSFDRNEFEKSKPLIRNRIKAYIARSAWNSKGWYKVANEYNETFQEALNHFDKAEHLASTESLVNEKY